MLGDTIGNCDTVRVLDDTVWLVPESPLSRTAGRETEGGLQDNPEQQESPPARDGCTRDTGRTQPPSSSVLTPWWG